MHKTLFTATNCVFLLVFLEVLVGQEDLVHFLLPQYLHLATHVDLLVPEDQKCQADHLHHVHLSAQANQILPRVIKKNRLDTTKTYSPYRNCAYS